jgi:Sigma-70, region 4
MTDDLRRRFDQVYAVHHAAILGYALRRAGDADREILTLAGWEGLDAGQIAVVLGCSRNAARIRLHRARRRFAAELHDTRTAFAPELIRGNS